MVGEHGDSELAGWRCAKIYGIQGEKFAELRGQKGFSEEMKEIYCSVRDSAYEIIKRKGATYYGIGMAAAKIAEALVRDSHTVAPVSVHLNGEYGLQDLCLSIPTVLGKNGAEQILEINFNEEEKAVYIRQAIFKEYRGNKEKRYGTLLLNEITDYLFSNYSKVHYIKARIHHDNISSMKMAWNCGFSNDEEIFSKENPYIKNKLK